MAVTILMRVGIEKSLVEEAMVRASYTGLTVTDVVNAALAEAWGKPVVPKVKLLLALSAWVKLTYDPSAFPADVTKQTFLHLLGDETLLALYYAATQDPATGVVVPERRDDLHRAIGAMVKVALNAKVVGRSLPLDPGLLIKTHALLAPS